MIRRPLPRPVNAHSVRQEDVMPEREDLRSAMMVVRRFGAPADDAEQLMGAACAMTEVAATKLREEHGRRDALEILGAVLVIATWPEESLEAMRETALLTDTAVLRMLERVTDESADLFSTEVTDVQAVAEDYRKRFDDLQRGCEMMARIDGALWRIRRLDGFSEVAQIEGGVILEAWLSCFAMPIGDATPFRRMFPPDHPFLVAVANGLMWGT